MNEKSLFNAALVSAIIGISILLVMQQRMEPQSIKINEVNMGASVKIAGFVVSKMSYEKITILKIKDDSGVIEVILNEPTSIPKGTQISVEGKVTEYKGKKQISANRIEIISIPSSQDSQN